MYTFAEKLNARLGYTTTSYKPLMTRIFIEQKFGGFSEQACWQIVIQKTLYGSACVC